MGFSHAHQALHDSEIFLAKDFDLPEEPRDYLLRCIEELRTAIQLEDHDLAGKHVIEIETMLHEFTAPKSICE